ncbi:MAG: GerMN domain-containing protein [Treponema sp.]|nr:GerMN domain-containing protein [Treponema sp.]
MKIEAPKLKRTSYAILLVILASMLISLVAWFIKFPGIRRSFVYQSSDSDKYRVEYRYLPAKPVQGPIQNYIDELLLGPVSEHCTPVFEKGTKVLSCFKKDNVLYINLSDDVLKADSQTTDFRKQIDLFEKNVFRNFGSINKIELFIDGKTAFDAD